MTINLIDTLSVFGNMNYLSGYISHLETEIVKNKETDGFLHEAPNYYYWLLSSSEYVYYKIRELLFYKNKDYKVFDYSYKSLLDELFEKYGLCDQQKEYIIYFAKIRHILVHKGFPNPHIVPSENERPITKGVILKKDEMKRICDFLKEPKHYESLKIQYDLIIKEISKLKGSINLDFGILSIKSSEGIF